VLTIEAYVLAAMGGVAAATLATMSLVFMLSIRLRRREIETMTKIGGAKGSIAAVLASEVAVVLVLGALVALGLTLITSQLGSWAVRAVLLL
jgi:ABC-type antimicrobial peptide transport system permease subunit